MGKVHVVVASVASSLDVAGVTGRTLGVSVLTFVEDIAGGSGMRVYESVPGEVGQAMIQ